MIIEIDQDKNKFTLRQATQSISVYPGPGEFTVFESIEMLFSEGHSLALDKNSAIKLGTALIELATMKELRLLEPTP